MTLIFCMELFRKAIFSIFVATIALTTKGIVRFELMALIKSQYTDHFFPNHHIE